jgi:hypothetical protein
MQNAKMEWWSDGTMDSWISGLMDLWTSMPAILCSGLDLA